ncbi:FtsK/SpoIIIE domain-containing protein [Streptomyces sp. NPDC058657]|uniref:FtsK/SpoIIIE domain-containing protein n=1 Tax=unclassified Streptomyces TaxID=2593676 RepID=UPI003657C4B1
MSARRRIRRTRSGARHLAKFLTHWAGGHSVSSEELLRRIVKARAEAHQDALEEHRRDIERAHKRATKLRERAEEDGGLVPRDKARLEAAEAEARRAAAMLAALGAFEVPQINPAQVRHSRQRIAAARCTLLAAPVAGIGAATVAGGAWWSGPAAVVLGVAGAWARGPEPLELTTRPVPADLIAATPGVVPPTHTPTPSVGGSVPAGTCTAPGTPVPVPGAPGGAPGLGGVVPASADMVTALSKALSACRVIPRGTHVTLVEEPEVTEARWTATIRLPNDTGATVEDVVAARKSLGGELELDRARLHVERVDGGDDKTLTISGFTVDPFEKPMVCTADMLGDVDVWDQGIPVAFDAWGRLLYVRLRDVSLLLGGSSRSGKGAALRLIIAGCLLDPRVKLLLADGKHPGQNRWQGLTDCHIHDPQTRAEQLRFALEDLVAEMGERGARLAAAGVESLEERSDLVGSEGLEIQVVVVDEVSVFTTDPKHGKAITRALTDLSARGLALGIVLVLSAQASSVEVISRMISANLVWRWCMYSMTAVESNSILGDGMAGRGYSAHLLPETQRGIGLLRAHGRVITLRSLWLDGDELAKVQDMVRALRGQRGTTLTAAPVQVPPAPVKEPVEALPEADWSVVDAWLDAVDVSANDHQDDEDQGQDDPRSQALEVIRQAGPQGIKRAAVADAIGASPTTVGGWLKTWADEGLVEVLGSPPHTRYAATDARQ